MFRGTLENGSVTQRKSGFQGKLTYDIWHCHPDGDVYQGVRRRSTLHVYMLNEESEPGKSIKVGLWVPGGFYRHGHSEKTPDGAPVSITWGEEIWCPVPTWGNATVVSFDNVPLKVLWESQPGKE